VAVDGNDVLAVVTAVREAHRRARSGGGPTFLELVTYRRGGHSSSDDPERYRDENEVAAWLRVDPIDRFRAWLDERGSWDAARDEALRAELRAAIDAAIRKAEEAPTAAPDTLFDHVYEDMPPHLRFQLAHGLKAGDEQEIEGAFPL
jgi:TPP-dependent pyruvate/acetoin dehydrogenase alpha subunit